MNRAFKLEALKTDLATHYFEAVFSDGGTSITVKAKGAMDPLATLEDVRTVALGVAASVARDLAERMPTISDAC